LWPYLTILRDSSLAVLYVDTTYDITLGLLGEDFQWLGFKHFHGQKVSSVLQLETYHLCQQNNLLPHQLESLIFVAGPGFYTGLRLSEGLADVFSFFGIPAYSFYTHELPRVFGIDSGVWITKAYRGEYFIYNWNKNSQSSQLISAQSLSDYATETEVFIHSESALDEMLRVHFPNRISTHEMLHQSPEPLVSWVLAEKTRRESYYFRAPEDEFRVSL
jgi:tRNA threonylcarbamoyladenosine biosynthesis protein TsaB